MFWIESKKVKIVAFSFAIIILQGCSSDNKKNQSKENVKKELTGKEQLVRQIESRLDISAAEKYDIQVLPEFIDSDTLKDKLILVNRKEFAYKHVKNTHSENFFEKTGHTGPYNYVLVKLGGDDKLLSTIPVGSNVNYPLNAKFLVLTSKARKDFYVDFRIKNSMQRSYYTIRNDKIYKTFSCPVFDSIGSKNPVVYDIEHVDSPMRIAKDIKLNIGKFIDYKPNQIQDTNDFEPKDIVSTGKLFAYFIFDDERMKYVTPMRPIKNKTNN